MSLLSRLAVQAARAYGILSSADKTKVTANFLVVAGGGSGGYNGNAYYKGGGGGAGGFRTSAGTSGGGASAESALTLSTLNTYTITVGAGGTVSSTTGTSGSNSSIAGTGITTITSIGGGYGGGGSTSNNGVSGGSGGGSNASSYSINQTVAGGSGTANQGYAGGTAYLTANTTQSYNSGSGGGGAGSVGGDGVNNTTGAGGNGGSGVASSISGSSVTYAGGGGGGGFSTGGTGGSGGGGAGGSGTVGTAGTANTGGGGGGSSGGSTATTNLGGSGIVIISYASATPKFVGGTLTTSGGNQIHTFTSSGTLSPLTPVTASYLVVAGGGSGGNPAGGGGGAGGLLSGSTTLYSGATYVVTVGAGGAGVAGSTQGNNGSNSVLSGTGLTTLTSIGGGSGQGGGGGTPQSGGSGGGAGANWNASGASGTAGQGYAGGSSNNASPYPSGGGGGAGAVGGNGSGSASGAGGVGVASSISGTSTYYAGGGGGAATTQGASAGSGGNGGGGSGALGNGIPGTTNTGGGGGGAGNSTTNTSGSGGSGVVIISYAGSQVFNGGLVTSSGGNTIHTFTATGALTPLTNNLNNSLRFRSSASAYLSRTPTVAGNRRTYTFSAWVKRGTFGAAAQALLGAGTSSTVYDRISFESDSIRIVFNNGTYDVNTTPVFRDPSAWYHIVVAMDTTQGTAANRTKIYVNGNQVTAFATASYPAQNHDTNINNNIANSIGALYAGSWGTYLDGYMTDINFIDGQALEPYYFGNNDANGVWKPIKYTGMYGTNGFYLTFGNTTSTTTLGYDSSPNGNNWTTNNISLTAGTTYDAMLDVPTNTSATVANYCVMNPLAKAADATLSNANLTIAYGSGSSTSTPATMSVSSGKWYYEFVCTACSINPISPVVGVQASSMPKAEFPGYGDATAWGMYLSDGNKFNNNTSGGVSYGSSFAVNDIMMCAFDLDNGKIWWGKNGTWFASGDPAAGTNAAFTNLTGSLFPAIGDGSGSQTFTGSFNFGQRAFSYTPPTGYVALNTYNL